MSKILAILFLFLAVFLPTQVHADELVDCPTPMRTDPTPIYRDPTKTPSAKFIVNLMGVAKSSDSSNWKMEFECGWPNKGPATLLNNDEIYREMKNTGTGCEFSAEPHTIKVFSGDTPICRARYSSINTDALCELKLNYNGKVLTPEDKVISFNTDLTVSGENLTKDGQFRVFVDNNVLQKGFDYVGTPSFSDVKIPKEFLTPTSHTISLRRYDLLTGSYGPTLCPLVFTVGSTSNPGSVVTKNVGVGASAGQPAASGGKQCGDKDNPGIATAIGCIHTNPAEFVKDLLKFVIGISGGIAFLMMLLGAFQMLTSAGNPDTLRAGRERLTSAVIGLLFVIFAVLLLQIIGFDILKIPGFGK